MPRHPSTVTLSKFRGLDNKNPPERLAEGFLDAALNVDIDATGSIRKREGYTQLIAGTNVHSLYGDDDQLIYMDNGTLSRYNKDTSITVLGTGYVTDSKVDYVRIMNRIYFSGIDGNGVIENDTVRQWGVKPPSGLPLLTNSSSSGLLNVGRYQVTLTHVSSDGRESGAQRASTVDVTDKGSIDLTFIPATTTDTTVTDVRIYCSTVDGDVMYLVAVIPLGTTTYNISNIASATMPLKTQFIDQAPQGELLQLYNGRIYMAVGNFLYYSEPHAYEWFDMSTNFLGFTSSITNVMPVDDGIYVLADKLYFLDGSGPESFRQRERETYKGVKRTAVKIIGSDVVLENIPTGLKWLFTSDKGIILVGAGGLVFNLTEKNVMLDKSSEGAAIFKSHGGINHYLSVLKNPDNNRLHVGDDASAEVIRNGITII